VQIRRIEIVSSPIDVGAELADIYANDAGGVCVFLGTTRSETNSAGQPLAALMYEAYEALALKQFQNLVTEAESKFPIRTCILLHRTGRVDVGQPSVLIAVATPHRAESFEACRWLIDNLKSIASIWKKELWNDGQTSWVAGTTPSYPSPSGGG